MLLPLTVLVKRKNKKKRRMLWLYVVLPPAVKKKKRLSIYIESWGHTRQHLDLGELSYHRLLRKKKTFVYIYRVLGTERQPLDLGELPYHTLFKKKKNVCLYVHMTFCLCSRQEHHVVSFCWWKKTASDEADGE